MSSDLYEALRRAAEPTLERMRQDGELMPPRLAALVAYIEENLFNPQLSVKGARKAARATSNAVPKQFRAYTETSIRLYIMTARLEIADRLLRLGRFEVGRVSAVVGYRNHETFIEAYKDWAGEVPSAVGVEPEAPEIEYPFWRRFCRRALDRDEARDFLETFKRLYPDVDQRLEETDVAGAPAPLIDINGESYERYRAREVWRQIRDLPVEAQRRWLRRCDVRSSALFDVLREISRQEGRRDRKRGVLIARLALYSLEGREEVFGERIHDLRALAHAWLGNAYRLALDFSAANAEFERAEAEWRVPRRGKDISVKARIRDLEASLRIFQRSYKDALRLSEHARELYELLGDVRGEVRVLLQQAAINLYTDNSDTALTALETATNLFNGEEDGDGHLAFVLKSCLTNVLAKAARYSAADQALKQCKACCKRLDHPLGVLKAQWLDATIKHHTGDLASAEHLYVAARIGYSEAEEFNSFAIISLDLAILYAEQDRWAETWDLSAEAVPILLARELHEETLAAIRLLAQSVETGHVAASLLREVRDRLLEDPLVELLI